MNDTRTIISALEYLTSALAGSLKSNDITSQVDCNNIMSRVQRLKATHPDDPKPELPRHRAIILPDDPNDKNVFALEAMADAFGLRIASVEIPDDIEKPEEPEAPLAPDRPTNMAEFKALVKQEMADARKLYPDMIEGDARVFDIPIAPMNITPPYSDLSTRVEVQSETATPAVKISKKTGKPKRGYVKGGRPDTWYHRAGRAKISKS